MGELKEGETKMKVLTWRVLRNFSAVGGEDGARDGVPNMVATSNMLACGEFNRTETFTRYSKMTRILMTTDSVIALTDISSSIPGTLYKLPAAAGPEALVTTASSQDLTS